METIQIVLDKPLLRAADKVARAKRQNRSALFRDALREYLRRLEVLAREEQEAEAYKNRPQSLDEVLLWEREAAWPAE